MVKQSNIYNNILEQKKKKNRSSARGARAFDNGRRTVRATYKKKNGQTCGVATNDT